MPRSPRLDLLMMVLRAHARAVKDETSPEQMRRIFDRAAAPARLPADVDLEPIDAGGVRAEWLYVPESEEHRTILYLHGGGYVCGSPATHRELGARLARASEARVLSVDYRLAPEHPFPAAVEDGVAAYRWLSAHVPPEEVVIAGDSAGGGLTIATLVRLLEEGIPPPAAAATLSPWVDLEVIGQSAETRARADPVVSPGDLRRFAAYYLGEGADPRHPHASPIHADLKGLPPLLIHVGTNEVLLDDARRLADRARTAGVDVIVEEWDEMIHVWHFFGGLLPEANRAVRSIAGFFEHHWR